MSPRALQEDSLHILSNSLIVKGVAYWWPFSYYFVVSRGPCLSRVRRAMQLPYINTWKTDNSTAKLNYGLSRRL